MNVLSLFDGMSCGRLALYRSGIPVTNYFAAEIDKYAIQVSKANWSDVTHVGDVTKLEAYMFPKIDLLIGGSPCQGFSFAGKQLNFDDPRSKLFFEYVRILNELKEENPSVLFLLENVVMKKEYQAVISEALGVEPILINSALVSAQNRKRLYWTNIPFYGFPRDKGIMLKDILETAGTGFVKNLGAMNERNERNEKAMNLDAGYYKGADNHGQRTIIYSQQENGNIRAHQDNFKKSSISEIGTIAHPDNKSASITSSHAPKTLIVEVAALTERRTEEAKEIRRENLKNGVDFSPRRVKELTERTEGKANCLTTGLTKEHTIKIETKLIGLADDLKGYDINRRIYSPEGKSPCLNSASGGNLTPKIALEDYSERSQKQILKNSKTPEQKAVSVCANSNVTGSGVNIIKLPNDLYLTEEEVEKAKKNYAGKVWKASGNKMENMKFPNDLDGKAKTILTGQVKAARETTHVLDEFYYRKLTPVECERLQTVPDNYTACVSNTQRYKMLGNGWNIDTICHLFAPIANAEFL